MSVDRRHLLKASLAVAGGALVGLEPTSLAAQTAPQSTPQTAPSGAPFYGDHQAGIATPAQDRLVFGAFDVKTTQAGDLRDLLRRWTGAAAAMSQGQPVPGITDSTMAPPIDTGEAAGLGASNLTVTFGFGPSLFDARFGLGERRPAALVDLPTFANDHVVTAQSGGDLAVQACADDPQVAFHAVRNLARLGRGLVTLRWLQLGFGRTSTTSKSQATPRNLMGFKDGTNNLKLEDTSVLDANVWVGDDADQEWIRGGSYMVIRRIRMRIESWDRTSLDEQEQTFGRRKTTGAPLNAQREFDTVDLNATDQSGAPVIPVHAHIRLASPDTNAGARLLRRGYSFTDGIDPVTGELDAGLFFICFQRDPRTGFVAVQNQLAASDALNEYIRHTASGVYACPPGIAEADYVGSALFT